MRPAAREVSKRIDDLVNITNEFAARRKGEMPSRRLDRVANFAFIVGVVVMLMMIGSAVFPVFSVARPIRRIGDVLLPTRRRQQGPSRSSTRPAATKSVTPPARPTPSRTI